ncbi:hypothetical protein GWI33_022456 [Rhynchophorus ferrugineus]|uniref:Uncharacterized protein n=1 Tax=Rhynchophorus ferrugineus TaxID=354439 RepID=A0A834MJ21_RHYFE|nr:hypothetical protein GWI33_022456 [Rhynchophorus ferrugineus]
MRTAKVIQVLFVLICIDLVVAAPKDSNLKELFEYPSEDSCVLGHLIRILTHLFHKEYCKCDKHTEAPGIGTTETTCVTSTTPVTITSEYVTKTTPCLEITSTTDSPTTPKCSNTEPETVTPSSQICTTTTGPALESTTLTPITECVTTKTVLDSTTSYISDTDCDTTTLPSTISTTPLKTTTPSDCNTTPTTTDITTVSSIESECTTPISVTTTPTTTTTTKCTTSNGGTIDIRSVDTKTTKCNCSKGHIFEECSEEDFEEDSEDDSNELADEDENNTLATPELYFLPLIRFSNESQPFNLAQLTKYLYGLFANIKI